MYKLFKLDCFTIVEGARVNRKVFINPRYVVSIEESLKITKIVTTTNEYYTMMKGDMVQEALANVERINSMMIMRN